MQQHQYSEFFVEFLGWYESRDYINIAMEYCPHGDLKKYLLDHGGRLPEDQVKDIASQVLAGVVMMHRAGFANRDIKPAVSGTSRTGRHSFLDQASGLTFAVSRRIF